MRIQGAPAGTTITGLRVRAELFRGRKRSGLFWFGGNSYPLSAESARRLAYWLQKFADWVDSE